MFSIVSDLAFGSQFPRSNAAIHVHVYTVYSNILAQSNTVAFGLFVGRFRSLPPTNVFPPSHSSFSS